MTKTRGERFALARTPYSKANLLTAPSVNKALEVCGNQWETLKYLAKSLYTYLEKRGLLKEYDALMKEIEILVQNAEFQENNKGNAWLGDKTLLPVGKTDFSLFQQFLADTFAKQLQEQVIVFGCAVSDNGEFIRGISDPDGNPLDDDAQEAINMVFNAWLAESHLINNPPMICVGTADGKLQEDKKGNPVAVQGGKLRAMLDDPKSGFAAFVQERNPSTKVDVRLFDYDEATAAPESPD